MTSVDSATRAKGIGAIFIASTMVIGVIAATPSCNGPPDKTCNADDTISLTLTERYPGPARCSPCLQSKNAPNACCDAVGTCAEDPACKAELTAAHSCVTENNPSEEARCKRALVGAKSKALYSCMRANCGEECGVPSCDLNPAFALFGNPSCDRCVGGACCEKINACYKNRECVMVVNCVVQRCPQTLAPALTALTLATAETRAKATEAICKGEGAPFANEELGCVQRCLEDFAPGTNATTDDANARCLAFGVFTCGAEANCGPICADAGASSGAYPEDGLPDASADDAKAP